MTVRIDNAVKHKCHTLDSTTHIIVTGPMTLRIGSAAKDKCNTFSSVVHTTVELHICICLQWRMYRNSARDGRDMVTARRFISKRVTKALHLRKVLENEGFEVSKKWDLD